MGSKYAFSEYAPFVAGFQLHVTVPDEEALEIHPGNRFVPEKNVTFPSWLTLAVIVVTVR